VKWVKWVSEKPITVHISHFLGMRLLSSWGDIPRVVQMRDRAEMDNYWSTLAPFLVPHMHTPGDIIPKMAELRRMRD